MAKLQDDPKVAALVEKSVLAAAKAENKRVVSIMKDALDLEVEVQSEDKSAVKLVKSIKKNLVDAVKL